MNRLRVLACIAVVALQVAPSAQAARKVSAFDGPWQIEWPCRDPDDPIQDEICRKAGPDSFYLELWSEERRLCGSHIATAHFNARVDQHDPDEGPSMVGRIEGRTATVAFSSAWGGSGHARLTVAGGKLRWQVLDKDGGQSWIPDEAVLTRQRHQEKRLEHRRCPTGLAPNA